MNTQPSPSTLKTFGGNTRDLGSILEETGQDCNFTQRRLEELLTEGGDGVRITCRRLDDQATASEEIVTASGLVVCKKEKDSDVMLIELIKNNDCPSNEELDEDGGNPLNLKIPCNIRHVHIGRAYIDLDSPLSIMTRTLYNWIMTNPLEPRKDPKSPTGISNFIRRIRGRLYFLGKFALYALDFMIVEDISSVIDPRMSPVVLGKPFVEISNMTYDLSLGVVKFINEIEEISYKMPIR
ncbi:hypothetical protein Tco_0572634 [Tanacetum coccineum]